MRIDQQVAIVTGAGSGIGRAIALRFARAGGQVMVAEIDGRSGEETVGLIRAERGEASSVVTDVTRAEQVGEMVKATLTRYGRIDILVNNAAIGRGHGILQADPAMWDRDVSVDLRGPYLCMRAVLQVMQRQGRGVIVNISSVNALIGLGHHAYSAAKAGLISLTQNVAVDFGPHGIRANVICPGTVKTPIWADRLAEVPDIFERLSRWYPLRRVGEPEEIAAVALFLASDESSFMTGSVVVVDGGLTAGMGRMADELMVRESLDA